MTLIHQISRLYHKLLQIGITEDLPFSEKLRTELCNQFIILAFPALFFHLAYNFLTINILREYLLAILWGLILSVTLVLNHHKKYLWARIYAIVIPLIMVAVLHILYGWIQRLDFLYLLFVLLSCYILERRTAIIMIAIVLMTYISVAVYLSFFEAPFAEYILVSGTFAYFLFAVMLTITLTDRVLRENHQYNQLVIKQNKILEVQNKELERFTYIASHDLKSPLRNIISFSSIVETSLKKGDTLSALQDLSYIQTSSKRMSYLIEDILELSKIKNGNKENRAWVDFNKIVEKSQYSLHQEIENKKAKIIYQNLPNYYCNETEFSLLFQNLIQNGIKYNENHTPQVEISVTQEDDALLLYFKDNGIGLDAQYHEQIFEYFKRLHNQTQYEGTGIGLGLCKKIVQNYDGKISVQSTPNQGSVFLIELPV